MKLFAIYIGGTHEHALIELHDMRFVIAENIEETYDYLRQSWWGIAHTLHIDSWGSVESVDDFDIVIRSDEPADTINKLFFINLGGYDPAQFTELHQNILVVAPDAGVAKSSAKQRIQHWTVPHKDYLYEVDKIINVAEVMGGKQWHIHLEPTKTAKPFQFISHYIPLGRNI